MLERADRQTPTSEIAAALERDGALIVENLIELPLIERLCADFEPHLDRAEWCNTEGGVGDDFFGRRTKRLHGLLARSPAFGDLIQTPLMHELCDHFLKPRSRSYRVSTGELMVLGHGESEQVLHRDADSWPYFPRPRPEVLVSMNVALTDFTEKNGGTVVVPGSHVWDPEREASREERVQVTMPRGSALLYSGNVLHGGGANSTDQIRIGLYVGYMLSWLRPLENHVVTNSADVLRAAPSAVQRLLSYNESGFEVIP